MLCRYDYRPSLEEEKWLCHQLSSLSVTLPSSLLSVDFAAPSTVYPIPQNFVMTGPPHFEASHNSRSHQRFEQPNFVSNPQTSQLCKLLDIPDTVSLYCANPRGAATPSNFVSFTPPSVNPSDLNSISLLPLPPLKRFRTDHYDSSSNAESINIDEKDDVNGSDYRYPDSHRSFASVDTNLSTVLPSLSVQKNPDEIDIDEE